MASDSAPPLSAAGVDFSNETQASDFLGQLLDDSIFQIDGNAMGRRFWYGVVVVIGVAAVSHFAWRLSLLRR
jgi:ferric-chelate reductase